MMRDGTPARPNINLDPQHVCVSATNHTPDYIWELCLSLAELVELGGNFIREYKIRAGTVYTF